MKSSTLTTAFALCLLSACSGPAPSPTASADAPVPETPPPAVPAAAETAPAADAKAISAQAGSSAADRAVSDAILTVFPDYVASQTGDDALPPARYVAVRRDLDGDGTEEVIVYLMGPFFCGTGGCSLLVLAKGEQGYREIGNVATARPPVRIVPTGGNGHADLLYQRSGGGGPTEDVLLAFRDGRYRKSSPAAAAGAQAPEVLIADSIDFTQGVELTPSR